ncbi:hypothetical protein [Nocardia camponoti]|uniref:Uncharacterized protein n=1 Tax=Nocardia camponoti TaxID=1616106 RepID=A0A917QTJ3_9NOCA|nr:hypothetical protein [Nocardia camponoti]GGK66738.1 hypothetical protein GCM10011591_43620 [Nocardia camponoti]
MTTPHRNAAELARLANVLQRTNSNDLAFLADLPPAALRAFREQITDRIAAADARRMHRVAAASKLVPAPIAAKITEAAFGPVLAAAIAGTVEPARAVAIASALSPKFLADGTVTLDPRRAVALIAEVPLPMAIAVARELISRRDYLTMGRLAGALRDEVLIAVMPLAADIDLLHIGYYLEDTDAADRLLTVVASRIPGLVRATNAENQWAEAISLLDMLGPIQRSHLADVVAEQDGDLLDGLLDAVNTLDAWPTLLPVAAGMRTESLRRLAERPLMQEEQVLTKIADLALTQNLWLDLLPLAEHLTPQQLATVATRIAQEPDDVLTDLVEQAHANNHWQTLLPVALALTDEHRARFATLPVMHRKDTLTAALQSSATNSLWPQALPLVTLLPTHTHDTLAAGVAALSDTEFREAIAATPKANATVTLVQVVLRQDPTARTRSLALLEDAPEAEALVASFAPTDPNLWSEVTALDLPPRLRTLLTAQAARCAPPQARRQLNPRRPGVSPPHPLAFSCTFAPKPPKTRLTPANPHEYATQHARIPSPIRQPPPGLTLTPQLPMRQRANRRPNPESPTWKRPRSGPYAEAGTSQPAPHPLKFARFVPGGQPTMAFEFESQSLWRNRFDDKGGEHVNGR